MRDTGGTFVWGLFAGKHVVTRLAAEGGDFVGQPVDLELDVDLADADVQEEVLGALDTHDPVLVTIAFPCDPWSTLQNLNYAQGLGDKIDEQRRKHYVYLEFTRRVMLSQQRRGRLGVAENPWSSLAWRQSPLAQLLQRGFELVRGDQCMFGLQPRRAQQDGRHMKPTGFLVPAGSPLIEALTVRCDGQHEHVHVMGGLSKKAGEWTEQLGQAMLRAAVQHAVQTAGLGSAALGGGRSRHDAVDITGATARRVSAALALRKERLEVLTGGAGVQLPFPVAPVARLLVLGFASDGSVIDVQDHWGCDAQRRVLDAPSPQADDKFIVIRVRAEILDDVPRES